MFTKWCASFGSVTSEDLVRHCNKVIFPFPSIGGLSNYPVQYLVQVRSLYRAELPQFVALSSCGRGYDFRRGFVGSDIMAPTTRRGSRVDRTLDLGNDVMANILCSFASAQDVLNSRCVCTAWRDLIARPGSMLGCTACNHRTVYVDTSHLRAFFWVKVLGTNCTSLTFQASEEACRRVQSEALRMLPGLAAHLPFPALDLPLLTECLVRCPNLTSLSIKCCSLGRNIAWEDLLRALMVSPRLGHMLTSLKLSHESFGSLTKGHLRKIARAMPNLASVDVPFDGHSVPLVWWAPFKNMRKLEAWRQTVLANELHQVLKACRQLEVIDMCASNIADFKEGWWRSDAPPQTVVKLRLTEMELPRRRRAHSCMPFQHSLSLSCGAPARSAANSARCSLGCQRCRPLKLGAHDSWLDGTQFERILATQPQLTALS